MNMYDDDEETLTFLTNQTRDLHTLHALLVCLTFQKRVILPGPHANHIEYYKS